MANGCMDKEKYTSPLHCNRSLRSKRTGKIMSARHSDKCSKTEVSLFKDKVWKFLQEAGIEYHKLLALRSYNGEVRIYTGNDENRLRLRMGRKLVAFKTPSGKIEGTNQEAIDRLKLGGDQLWESTNEPIRIKQYISMYRADDWGNEKKDILEYFKVKKVA